jgi:hypothetical protein
MSCVSSGPTTRPSAGSRKFCSTTTTPRPCASPAAGTSPPPADSSGSGKLR